MGKEHQKRVLAALMAASIAIPTPVLAASPADFSDFPNNWATNALSYAVSNGLLSGDSGKIRANDTLKRAEMAAILNRLAGAVKGASLTGYTDVPTTAWYYEDMAKAVQMGTFAGDGGMLRPEAPITRQEVFAVLARFYCLEQSNTDVLQQYADSSQIAPWARDAVAAMVQAGYIHGNEGKLSPLAPITRAEFSQVLYQLAGNIAEDGKTADANLEGNLIVRKDDASLRNVTVKGDLIIADGAQRVKLDNVKVEGRILVRGGADGVEFSKTTAGKGVLAVHPIQTNFTAADSSLGDVTLSSDTKLSGDFDKVQISKPLSLTVEKGKIGAVQVESGAENTKIQVEKDGTVSKVEAKAKGTQISGAGSVGEVHAGGDGVQVFTENTKVITGDNVSGVQAGGKEVQPKTTVTTDQKSAEEELPVRKKKHSSSSSGSSSSSSSSSEETKKGVLADGIWYGTGTDSLYYQAKGPDIVRVVVKDGQVTAAYSEKHIEDESFERGQNVLNHVKGIRKAEDVDKLEAQLRQKTGAAYDAVSGATETAKGHLSALKNAVLRAEKYSSDQVKQNVQWFDFEQKPKANMNFGEKLDLTGTVLKVHLADGQTKSVPFDKISEYGITTNIENGTVITKDTPGVNQHGALQVQFRQNDGLIVMPAKVVASKKTTRKTPTHLLITFADGKTQKMELDENEFNYSIKAEGKIKDIKVYDNDRLLTAAVYHEEYNDWEAFLREVSPGEGFTGWKYNTYYISIDNQTDDSAVASFTLDTELLQTVYGVGYKLDLSLLNINLVTEKGSKQRKKGWDACKAKGFTAEPDQDYIFTKEDAQKGTKTIQIKNNGVTQSFNVQVIDYEKQIPAKIELSSKTGEPIQTITIPGEKWKNAHGMYSLYNVKMPETYQKWEKDTFTIKVYNAAGEALSDYTVEKAIDGKALEIAFPHYTEYDSYGGYVRLLFDFSDKTEPAQPEGEIADGEWYGTATWGRYYPDRGPNVVKVTVKDGVITNAESIKYTDDTKYLYTGGENILKKAVGLSDLSILSKALTEKKGDAFDAVSGATETAKGHLSAMENALAKAKQYSLDQKDQQIAWMEFKVKPALTAKFNMPLDLSQTELTLHMTDGKEKTVPFNQLQEYDIVTNYQNGDTITKQTEGMKNDRLLVKFTHELSQTTIPVSIAFFDEVKQKSPTHILVTMQDEKTQKIPLEENKFRYRLETEGSIKAMAIYDNDKKLADGVFEDGYNSWKFALKGVAVGDDYTGWKFENYFVDLDTSADTSAVASFTLDASLVPKKYAVGEAFQLDNLNISLKTEKGSSQRLNGWAECRNRGFAASVENGHRFTAKEVGKQTITISVGDHQQTFQVEVKDYASQIPAKVELYDSAKDTLLQTITVENREWKTEKGCVTKKGIELPDTYKGWKSDTFKVKVYNSENELIQDEVYKVGLDYYKEALEIDFPNYKEYYGKGGYLKMYFSFQKTTEGPTEEPNATAEGSAKVGEFGYDAKVTVIYNKKTKEIVSVTDNGTEAGGNDSFWKKAAAMFEKFKGKTAKDIDGIDAVASATVSSEAIKEAVKKALGEETETTEEATETAEGSKTVGSFGYDAKVTVTYNKKTGEIVSVTDNGTEAGGNDSFWKKAAAMFEKFKGKTAKDIDGIDAVASATVSSEAIKGAVKEALSSKSGEVSEPKVTAADLRTNLLFAATENALLNISAPEGADVFYTTDGSDPKGDDASKKKLNQPTLSLNGNGNDADETISLKLAAQKDGKWSKVLEIPLTFVKIPPLDTGTKVYTGQAECKGNEGKPYTVKVRVTTVNGRIALLEDNGTEIPGTIDESFWLGGDVMGASGMPEKLKGKTLEEVLKARTTPSEKEEEKVDAISGATLSSDTVKYAVIDALRSKPIREGTGEIAPPTFQSTRQVAPNGKINSIFVTMKAPEGAVIHYTTDGSEPTEESPTPSKDPIFHEDSGAELKAERETYADGRVILLKAAAFQDGKRSETVTGRYVFANPNPKHSYELGQFSGKADGITARVEFESPNFDQKYYLTKIRLDDASEKAYAAFLPELFSQIYLKQGVEGVTPISGHEEESRKVLAAVQAALQEGSVAAEPVITVSPKQGNYSNDEKVTVEIACATDGAEIYYVVENSNDLTSGKLSDFEKHKALYEKPLTLTVENPKGGTLYIRAAAKVGEKNWSPTARKDLTFVKAVGTEAFEVNGSKYGTWKEAVSALEEAGSGEIILGDDVELQEKDAFPSVSCTIRSGDERKCKIKGGVMEARADITFENVVYDVNRIYGNGHSVTIGADVETPFSFTKRAIFAGTAHDAEEKEITANPVLSVESGKFALYGSGSSGTTLKGNVEIKVKGTADVEIAGAYMNSTVNGKVTVSVEDEAVLSEFLGELSKGSVKELELVMTGSPKLDGRTFRGTVNGEPKGTLDLRQASLSPEQVEKFKDFAEVLKADSPAAEETLTKPDEETVTVEKEKEEAAEEAAVIAKMIAEAVSDFSDPGESDLL
ncbi:FMN-binding protein [Anaerotignum lactatifermentans]|uniref:FMN-binding protein n=1 Tax=Anaerotignum lactatifermentans TaxID=160404 RepID=UPI00266CABA6|nr:FMN-binding protein [Anaerotignum lactatifermentans]